MASRALRQPDWAAGSGMQQVAGWVHQAVQVGDRRGHVRSLTLTKPKVGYWMRL